MTELSFRGYRIVEAKTDSELVCDACAAYHQAFCSVELFDAAEAYFGGDCEHRDVIYAIAKEPA